MNAAENLLLKILGKPKNNFSYSIFGSFGIAKMINDYDPDIVNLHWVAGNMLSVNDIRKIKAPAGLDIGAVTPEEISLSILAELLKVRKNFRNGIHDKSN